MLILLKQFVAKSADYLEKIKFAWLCSMEYNLIHGVEIEILILKCIISLRPSSYITI